ncbi:MAG: flagellar motor switch protein FliG [Sphingobacteriia bacterium]|nr:flagellar motor switch protein FliG [Sphingobacteriia bacterium]
MTDSLLTGSQKAAIVLLSMSEENATKIFSSMSEEEIKAVSFAMTTIGSMKQEMVEKLLLELNTEITSDVSFIGNFENTEKLLEKILGKEKVAAIMEEITGPVGKNTWDKLSNVNEDILTAYLRNEHPQTIALVVSKLTAPHAAKVLGMLPEDTSIEVMLRMLSMDAVKKEILDNVERTLRMEFISTLSKTQKQDSNAMLAEIFNNFDRVNEAKFMGMLEEKVPESAEKIKALMFTFDDLTKVTPQGIQVILRVIDKSKLAVALKGGSDAVKQLFLNSMSQRAAKILNEEMAAMGPVRIKDVDEAQSGIIKIVKDLAAKGDIVIADSNAKDEFIY